MDEEATLSLQSVSKEKDSMFEWLGGTIGPGGGGVGGGAMKFLSSKDFITSADFLKSYYLFFIQLMSEIYEKYLHKKNL